MLHKVVAPKQITYVQGYKAMYFFIEEYHHRVSAGDDVAVLLSSLLFIDYGNEAGTSDPASWYDWIDSIHKTFPELEGKKEGELTNFQAFQCMDQFLCEYRRATSSEEFEGILGELLYTVSRNDSIRDPVVWERWIASIQKAIHAKTSGG